ncbi:MAG TPA: transposase zinc-binding domain-containing protein, partial [Burkholderiales bacterium]|nr:transposase zinc-binding domain-containing protein [Burkholderiales bacterium]
MDAIQEIFRRHAPAYRAQFGETMPLSHARVIEAIIDCRSAACGSILYQCEECAEPQVCTRCCGNRHCPVCQQGKAEAWLSRQLERQLPTPHFMLTFTVPANLREFLRCHPREGYGALFTAS